MLVAYLGQLWQTLLELAPSLLLGLGIAGLLHVYLPTGWVHRHLNQPNLASVLRASIYGVPLPLCSCGVIPTALGLRRDGAAPGATTAFMISTPQTGVDSILVSAAFLGWPFALFKLAAAFVTGVVGGALVNRLVPSEPLPERADPAAAADHRPEGVIGALRYAVFDLLAAIDLWLIGGVLLAALIATLTPADFFAGQPWARGLTGMLVVLAISLPLYVCTTASVPIAASLIAAGMPAGSALVFLMAGPATNVATMGAVYRALGARVLGLYVGTVAVLGLLFGLVFDGLLSASAQAAFAHHHGTDLVGTASALLLIGLLGWLSVRRVRARFTDRAEPPAGPAEVVLRVGGMSCQHCVGSVKRALEALPQVESAEPDLARGEVRVRGGFLDAAALVAAVEQAGFRVTDPP